VTPGYVAALVAVLVDGVFLPSAPPAMLVGGHVIVPVELVARFASSVEVRGGNVTARREGRDLQRTQPDARGSGTGGAHAARALSRCARHVGRPFEDALARVSKRGDDQAAAVVRSARAAGFAEYRFHAAARAAVAAINRSRFAAPAPNGHPGRAVMAGCFYSPESVIALTQLCVPGSSHQFAIRASMTGMLRRRDACALTVVASGASAPSSACSASTVEAASG
jgi:hypothetical protein